MYTISIQSIRGKLVARYFKAGKYITSEDLGVPCSSADLKNPHPALAAIIAKKKQDFSISVWNSQLTGGNPLAQKKNITVDSIFKGTSFYDYIGEGVGWNEITGQVLFEYKEYLHAEDYATNTKKKYLSQVKAGLDKAVMQGVELSVKDYAEILKNKKGKKGTTTSIYLTRKDLEKLSEVSVDNIDELSVKFYSLLSAYTGARFSDVIRLAESNIEDSDLGGVNKHEIVYVSKKTETPARLPLKPIVRSLLARLGELKPISNNKANQILPELCRRAGICDNVKVFKADKGHEGQKWEFVRTHTMRKSFATNVYLSGMYDLRSISLMMGHARIETTSSTYIICGIKEDNGINFNYFE